VAFQQAISESNVTDYIEMSTSTPLKEGKQSYLVSCAI